MSINDVSLNNALGRRWAIGGGVILNPFKSNFKTLFAYFGSNGNATPREIGATSGYLVPTGKRFVIVGTKAVFSAHSAGNRCGIQSATSDIGQNSASTPTGRDYAAVRSNIWASTATTDSKIIEKGLTLSIPAGKYLHAMSENNNSGIMIYGYEIDETATSF